MHLVLIGLNSNAGKSRIGANVIRLSKAAVTGGETALEKLYKVNLTAGFRQHIEILIVDMNVTVGMSGGYILGKDAAVDEILGAFGAVFQHGTHGCIGINVSVFTLDVCILGRPIGELIVYIHEVGFRLTNLSVGIAVNDVCLGGRGEVILNESALYGILNILNAGSLYIGNLLYYLTGELVKLGSVEGFIG